MKKIIPVAIISLVLLVLSNVYYYRDTYQWQIRTQENILSKELLICYEEIDNVFNKTETNVLLLLEETEINALFSTFDESKEVQKRLEFLYSRYGNFLYELEVFNADGNCYSLRKGANDTFISSFSEKPILQEYIPHINFNTKQRQIFYTQPLIADAHVYGYARFALDMNLYFKTIFKNFNLDEMQFQWVLQTNGTVLFNTLKSEHFYPDDIPLELSDANDAILSKVHPIMIGDKSVEVLSVFHPIEFNNLNYYLVFSLPEHLVVNSILRNTLLIAIISVIILLLFLVLFLYLLKRTKQEEVRLKDSEEALKKILYYLPVGILLLDSDNRVKMANKAALKILAFDDEDQLIGRYSTQKELFENKIKAQKGNYRLGNNKYQFQSANGKDEIIINEKIPIFLQRERLVIDVFIDVSIVQATTSLAENSSYKSNFIANISHELRTPLNGIIGMTDLIMNTCDLPENEEGMMQIVKRSADTLLALINDILDYSKIEAGKMELESIPFDLNNEIDSTLQMFYPRAKERNIQLTWHTSFVLPSDFLGDPLRIRQVLNNLLSNAIKFTPEGKIHLSISKNVGIKGEPVVYFSLQDTGIGIPLDKQKKIFKAFSQADESTTRQFGGTGLGTSISKQLVHLMGGEIWVDSPSKIALSEEYPGSEFCFTVPFKTATKKKFLDFSSINTFEQIRAIIISDNLLQVQPMSKNLNALRIKYDVFSPTQETIAQLKHNALSHLLIIDHRPDFSGLDFLQELYNHDLHNNFLILLQSSDFQMMNMNIGKRLGADVYFRKPVRFNVLYDFVLKNFPSIKKDKEIIGIGQTRRLNVLVADDSLINQKVAQRLFKNIGYNIDIANNGIEAVSMYQNKKYDIVFMDIYMPESDGITAVKEIKGLGGLCPVIAMTATNFQEEGERALAAGMDDFISKPTKQDDLSRMLVKWCLR